MAVSCALGWQADKLFFLTDVAGVGDGEGRVLPILTPSSARQLVATGVAHGGMQAKLEAALLSLENGLSEVIVAPGQHAGICQRLLEGEALGTRLALEAV